MFRNRQLFLAPDVLNRWKYIYGECDKRKISVVSFGSDGDSRNLRAMTIYLQSFLLF